MFIMTSTLIANRYRLDHLLGRVNHSRFFQGFDTHKQARILIRLIDLDQEDRKFRHKLEGFMQNEFRVVAQLTHPNVLQTLDYGQYEQIYFQINEFFPFTTLQQYMLEKHPLELPTVLRFVMEIADTLTYFHRINIVHCDVKPENILVNQNQLKLMEFSIANHILEEGIVTGTPPYMSPEAATGAAPAQARDIWALGITLFEMLSGRLPYQLPGRMQDPAAMPDLLRKIVTEPVPPLETYAPDLPPRLIALVNWMLEKEVSRRMNSMRQVAAELETITGELQQSGKRVTVGQVINDRYRLQSVIAEGGFGQVFTGADLQTGNKIALKRLKPEFASETRQLLRFRREAEILRSLNHPAILKIFDTLELGTGHYLIMEYAEGGDLRSHLKGGAMSFEKAVKIAAELADALAHVHDLGILHRDIKPANVIFTAEGAPRLADFGISFINDATRLTETNGLVGTLQYMAPETLQGSAPSKLADIWSFGTLLYEMLTGNQPFLRMTVSQIILAVLNEPIPEIGIACDECPEIIAHLITNMLERNPAQRINDMHEVAKILKGLQS
jgi:serine/threonine protein kinase